MYDQMSDALSWQVLLLLGLLSIATAGMSGCLDTGPGAGRDAGSDQPGRSQFSPDDLELVVSTNESVLEPGAPLEVTVGLGAPSEDGEPGQAPIEADDAGLPSPGNRTVSVTVQAVPGPGGVPQTPQEIPGSPWRFNLSTLPWNQTLLWKGAQRFQAYDWSGGGGTLSLRADAVVSPGGPSSSANLSETLVLPVASEPDDGGRGEDDGREDASNGTDSPGNKTQDDDGWSRSPSPNEHGVHLIVTGNRSTVRPGEELRIAVTAQTRRNQTIYHQPGCGGSLVVELRDPDGDPVRSDPPPSGCEPGAWEQVPRGGWVGEAFTWNGTVWNGSAYRNVTPGTYVAHTNFTYRPNETARNRSLTETYTVLVRDEPGPVGSTNQDNVLVAQLEANRTAIHPGETMHVTMTVRNVGNTTMGLKTECWDWWAYDFTLVTPDGEERHAFGPAWVCASLRYLALEPGEEHVLGHREVTRWNGTFRTADGWEEAEPGNYTLRSQVRGYFPDGPNPHKRLWTQLEIQVLNEESS